MQNRYNPLFPVIHALPAAQLGALRTRVLPGSTITDRGNLTDALVGVIKDESALKAHLAALGFNSAPAISETEFKSFAAIAERAEQAAIKVDTDLHNITSSLRTDIANLHHRLQTDGVAVSNKISGIANAVTTIQTGIQTSQDNLAKKVDSTLADISAAIKAAQSITIDPAVIDAAVNRLVQDAFAPFKKAVVAAGAESKVAEVASAVSTVGTGDAKNLFGIDARDTRKRSLQFTIVSNPAAPAVDNCFIWTAPVLRVLNLADKDKGQSFLSNIWAGGEKGTGKTQTAYQFAARTGRPYFRINFQKYTMLEDICGAMGLKDGNTEHVPGPLLQGISTPYSVINLDEPSLADPGVMGFLNALLEPGSTVSYGGKVWTRAVGVIVFVSDNTLGSGDMSGRYAGTRTQSAALLDRFGLIHHFDYLPRADEIAAVVRHTGCKDELADHVLSAISICRQKVSTGEIVDAPSIRSVVSFIRAMDVLSVEDAWNSSIAARQPAESAVALKAVYESSINVKLIQSLL